MAAIAADRPYSVVDSNGIPRRIPRLAVRNRIPEGESTTLASTTPATTLAETDKERSRPSSLNAPQAVTPPSLERNWSDESFERIQRRRNQERESEEPELKPHKLVGKKKKGSNVLGFLTLKEPSTAALEQFAQAEKEKEKEKARQNGGRTPSTVLSGVSSQKLPDYVPKVNSKWDGLPESAKRMSAESRRADKRSSTFSTSTRRSNWTSQSNYTSTTWTSADTNHARKTFGSMSSRPTHSPTYSNAGSTHSHIHSPLQKKLSSSSKIVAQHPALRSPKKAVEETNDNRPQTFLHPPSPPYTRDVFASDPVTTPELEGPDTLHELGPGRCSSASPRVQSPITPTGFESDPGPALVGVHYPELASPDQIAAADRNITFWNSDTDHEDMKPKRARPPNFRRAVNFSRPRFKQAAPPPLQTLPERKVREVAESMSFDEERPVLLPTLKNSSGRIEPFLTDTFAAHSRVTGRIPKPASRTVLIDPELQSPNTASRFAGSNPGSNSKSTTYPTERTQEPTHKRESSEESITKSIDPSVMSERWPSSSKERLGLGANVRRNEVTPWETAEATMNNAEGTRNDRLYVPMSSEPGKRLSWRISGKK